jgi:translation initiation factor 1
MARKKDHITLGDSQSLGNNPFAALLEGSPTPSAPSGNTSTVTPPAPSTEWTLASLPRVVLRMERKGHGGKTVTVLTGFEAPPGALKKLSRQLKKQMGCGARIMDSDVVLQGDLRERVRAWLLSQGVRRVV